MGCQRPPGHRKPFILLQTLVTARHVLAFSVEIWECIYTPSPPTHTHTHALCLLGDAEGETVETEGQVTVSCLSGFKKSDRRSLLQCPALPFSTRGTSRHTPGSKGMPFALFLWGLSWGAIWETPEKL